MGIRIVVQPAKDRSSSWPTGRVGTERYRQKHMVTNTFHFACEHLSLRMEVLLLPFQTPRQHTCLLPFRVCAALSHHSSTYLLHFIRTTHIAVFLLLSLPITKAIGGTSPNTWASAVAYHCTTILATGSAPQSTSDG
jgi:hypothetical protein